MSQVMMMLGDYPFMLNTAAYEKLTRNSGWRWRNQARIGRTPANQYLGPEAQTISMNGMILPEFKGGQTQVTKMRAAADQGEPLILVDGRGKVWGEFVIKSLSETQSLPHANGDPRRIDFQISLEEYGEDQGGFGASPLGLAISAVNALRSAFS